MSFVLAPKDLKIPISFLFELILVIMKFIVKIIEKIKNPIDIYIAILDILLTVFVRLFMLSVYIVFDMYLDFFCGKVLKIFLILSHLFHLMLFCKFHY